MSTVLSRIEHNPNKERRILWKQNENAILEAIHKMQTNNKSTNTSGSKVLREKKAKKVNKITEGHLTLMKKNGKQIC